MSTTQTLPPASLPVSAPAGGNDSAPNGLASHSALRRDKATWTQPRHGHGLSVDLLCTLEWWVENQVACAAWLPTRLLVRGDVHTAGTQPDEGVRSVAAWMGHGLSTWLFEGGNGRGVAPFHLQVLQHTVVRLPPRRAHLAELGAGAALQAHQAHQHLHSRARHAARPWRLSYGARHHAHRRLHACTARAGGQGVGASAQSGGLGQYWLRIIRVPARL
jgi:hypothetical protein